MTKQKEAWQGLLCLSAILGLSCGSLLSDLWSSLHIGQAAWSGCNMASALLQWPYPALVVVTGSLFFSAERPWNLQFLWKNAIPKAAAGWIILWLASAVVYLGSNYPNEMDMVTFGQCLGAVLDQPGCIGFCEMLCTMFILYPMIWKAAQNRMLVLYVLVLFFAMCFAGPMMAHVPVLGKVTLFTNQLNWGYFSSWTFYLFLGIFLCKYETRWYERLVVYCLGIISNGLMAALTSWNTGIVVGYVDDYIGFSSPFTALQTAAVVLAVYTLGQRLHSVHWLRSFGDLWYGAPILFIVNEFTGRFVPDVVSGGLVALVVQALLNTVLTAMLILALRHLVGLNDAHGGGRT